jgi:hypothetical protein
LLGIGVMGTVESDAAAQAAFHGGGSGWVRDVPCGGKWLGGSGSRLVTTMVQRT